MIMDRTGSRFPSKVRYGTSLEYAFILSKGRPRTITLLRTDRTRESEESRTSVEGSLTGEFAR